MVLCFTSIVVRCHTRLASGKTPFQDPDRGKWVHQERNPEHTETEGGKDPAGEKRRDRKPDGPEVVQPGRRGERSRTLLRNLQPIARRAGMQRESRATLTRTCPEWAADWKTNRKSEPIRVRLIPCTRGMPGEVTCVSEAPGQHAVSLTWTRRNVAAGLADSPDLSKTAKISRNFLEKNGLQRVRPTEGPFGPVSGTPVAFLQKRLRNSFSSATGWWRQVPVSAPPPCDRQLDALPHRAATEDLDEKEAASGILHRTRLSLFLGPFLLLLVNPEEGFTVFA